MSNTFSRTMRSLSADSYTTSLVWLGISLLLLIFWCLWFFTAKVTIYKTSIKARLTKDERITANFPHGAFRVQEIRQNRVIAEFPAEDMPDIRPGQSAEIYLDGDEGKKAGTLHAFVTEIAYIKGKPIVELFTVLNVDSPIRLREGLTGKVMVKTRYTSPAAMVMQISGLFN